MKRLPASDISIHPDAQRQLVQSKLKQLETEMDLDAVGVIHVVEGTIQGRHGFYCVDGQHRIVALQKLGLGDWLVDCLVHVDADTEAKACQLFLTLNNRSPVSSFDTFEKEVKAGHADAVGSSAVAASKGLRVSRTAAEGAITAVAALKKAYAHDSGASLGCALEIILKAWGNSPAALEGKLIEALSVIIHTYNGQVDQGALASKMAKFNGGAHGVIGKARMYMDMNKASMLKATVNVMLAHYNAGRRTGTLELL
jgi:hypothetical protein